MYTMFYINTSIIKYSLKVVRLFVGLLIVGFCLIKFVTFPKLKKFVTWFLIIVLCYIHIIYSSIKILIK